LFGAAQHNSLAQPAPANDGLQIAAASLDFGEIPEKAAFSSTIPIDNPTGRDIQIERFTWGCKCVSVRPQSLLIRAGQTAHVALVLDIARKDVSQSSLALYEFKIRLVPHFSGGRVGQGWTLSGRVRSSLAARPCFLHFTEPLVRGQRFQPAVCRVVASVALRDLSAQCDPSASVRVDRATKTPEEYMIIITPAPTLPVGRFAIEIALVPTRMDGAVLPRVMLRADGEIHEAVQAIPGALLLGLRPIGQPVSSTIVLRSNTGRPFEVQGLDCPWGQILLKPIADGNRGSAQAFEITVREYHLGDNRLAAQIIVEDAAGRIRVPLDVHLYGSRPLMGKVDPKSNRQPWESPRP
jgi:hypothetical protein